MHVECFVSKKFYEIPHASSWEEHLQMTVLYASDKLDSGAAHLDQETAELFKCVFDVAFSM